MPPAFPLPVAILAGGLATRLRPVTEKIPKSLVPVAGRPILAHQLELLRSHGITRAVLCVGHLGEMIQREFGDGSACGVRLDYSFDGPVLLGTGGAIRQALPKLGREFFVLYGDSYLPIDYRPIAEFFERSGKRGLMTVFRNEGLYDASNVVFRDGEVVVYDKKVRLPEMRHIDYGLSLFKAEVFEEWPAGERRGSVNGLQTRSTDGLQTRSTVSQEYPAAQKFDLADVMGRLVREKQLAGFEVPERFYEIGSPEGLRELEAWLARTS